MCMKRHSNSDETIKVPISRMYAVEAQVLNLGKKVQSMTKLLKIGVESGTMSKDWTTQAQNLIDRA